MSSTMALGLEPPVPVGVALASAMALPLSMMGMSEERAGSSEIMGPANAAADEVAA